MFDFATPIDRHGTWCTQWDYVADPGKTICHDKAFVRALREAFDLPPIKKAS